MRKAEIAVIGGSFVKLNFPELSREIRIGTRYGIASPIFILKIEERAVAFLPRHGVHHTLPPHKINYKANVYALHRLGVERIIAIHAVGAINKQLRNGDLVVPKDFLDFTRKRETTFYDEEPAVHIDLSEPYCPEIRKALIGTLEEKGVHSLMDSVIACMEGPRFETPAEVKMLQLLGVDVVGMTSATEAVLARELEMCYASLCFVSNMAAGIGERVSLSEIREVAGNTVPVIEEVLREALDRIPLKRGCVCAHALEDSKV